MSIKEAFAKTSNKDAAAGSWLIVQVSKKNKASEFASGSGLDSFKEALDEKLVLFGVINVHGVDERANVKSVRTKLVQVNFVGSSVPAMKRMMALQGKGPVAKLFGSPATSMDVTSADDITAKEIVSELCAAGGAHKPTYYDFGSEKVNLDFYDGEKKES